MKTIQLLFASLAFLACTSLWAQGTLMGTWEYVSTETFIEKEVAAQRGGDVSDIPDGGHLVNTSEASESRQRHYIFADGYYSFFGLNSNQPRPLRRDVDEGATGGRGVTSEQKLREYSALDVEFGSYTVEGNQIVARPIMDHIPDNMLQDGAADRIMTFELDGDTLVLIRDTGDGAVIHDTFERLN